MAVNTFYYNCQNTEFGVDGLLIGTLALALKKLFPSCYRWMTYTSSKDGREGRL